MNKFKRFPYPASTWYSIAILSGLLMNVNSYGQTTDEDLQLNTITTAVPFLMITPDARHGAMGDAGVATTPDAASSYWNPAKWAFIEEKSGLQISYTPWLSNLVSDMGIMYISGFHRVGKRTTMAASLKYFSLGNITFTDQIGTVIKDHNPNEFAIDVAAGTQLSKKFSGGIAGRFIYSNLTDGVGGTGSKQAAMTGAVDVSGFYQDDVKLFDRKAKVGVGLNISNIGAKMAYTTSTGDKDFIPTNLKLGQATKVFVNDYNSITLTTDLNKLLVPTPLYDENGNKYTPDVSVASGIFGSFSDAPGGFEEEIREINISVGLEYWYENIFSFRTGYFYESPYKGDRQYFTMGFGLKLNVFSLDGSYLIANRNNPLANTFRFTLGFSFDSFKGQKTAVEDPE